MKPGLSKGDWVSTGRQRPLPLVVLAAMCVTSIAGPGMMLLFNDVETWLWISMSLKINSTSPLRILLQLLRNLVLIMLKVNHMSRTTAACHL